MTIFFRTATNSVYELTDTHVRRVPHQTPAEDYHPLRGDYEWAELHDHGPIELGWSVTMFITLPGRDSPTTRVTSAVTSFWHENEGDNA